MTDRIECPTCHQEVDTNEPRPRGRKAERRWASTNDQLRFARRELERIADGDGDKDDAAAALVQLDNWPRTGLELT